MCLKEIKQKLAIEHIVYEFFLIVEKSKTTAESGFFQIYIIFFIVNFSFLV